MKSTYKYIFAAVAMMAAAPVLSAQTTPQQKDNESIETSKKVKDNGDGTYTLTLESYVKGQVVTTTVEERVPVDAAFVLDVSGSMDDKMTLGTFGNWDTVRASLDTEWGAQEGIYSFTYRLGIVDHTYKMRYQDGVWQYDPILGGWRDLDQSIIDQYSLGSSNPIRISRIDALKIAVNTFLKVFKDDAEQNDLDNQIAIVKFASDQYKSNNHLAEGNDKGAGNSSYNYTQLVKNFTSVTDGFTALKTANEALSEGGATASDYGMQIAKELFEQSSIKNRVSTKVVIMVTDGTPTHGNSWDAAVANAAITNAQTLKDAGALVYTVGLFDSITANEKRYMNAVSSNTKNASVYTDGANADPSGYFVNSATSSALSAAFESIANEVSTGGASISISSSSIVRDVVTDSFEIPAEGENIRMFTSDATLNSDGAVTAWGSLVAAPGVSFSRHDNTDGTTTVDVTGFDFSGHWVGKGADSPKKLVIKIDIKQRDGSVGGPIHTNTSDSGIIVIDENGNETLMEDFEIPTANVPVNIQITKVGLAKGESASFIITRGDEYFTTVVLTGTGDADPVVKLVNLPSDVYTITESDWSWTYTKDANPSQTTSGISFNPFTFTNVKKSDVTTKNAEAVVRNDFKANTAKVNGEN